MASTLTALPPASLRLVRTLIADNRQSAKTPEFLAELENQLASYGWKAPQIEQALSFVDETP